MINSNEVAKAKVKNWLSGEHPYQFDKNRITHNADPSTSIVYILRTELGNKWHRFQVFNGLSHESSDTRLQAQAAQQVLKTCAGARGALVWSYVNSGFTLEEGSESSWKDLDNYYTQLANGKELPHADLLTAPLSTALAPASIESGEESDDIRPVFTQLAGLAITYLINQQERTGATVIPEPGTASGEIHL